ncbi:MAG: DinB family protein [Bacteroidota bacterium]
MKELLQQYAAFNLWATQKITDAILLLPEEKINAEITSSFPTMYKTVLHLLDAESIWWQRLKLQEHIERPSETFTGSFAELQKKLLQQSTLFSEWVSNANEPQLQHVFAYIRDKEQNKMPVWSMLLHLFNHNSYHRGQLVTMLRQSGVTKIPSTDFSVYLRSKK